MLPFVAYLFQVSIQARLVFIVNTGKRFEDETTYIRINEPYSQNEHGNAMNFYLCITIVANQEKTNKAYPKENYESRQYLLNKIIICKVDQPSFKENAFVVYKAGEEHDEVAFCIYSPLSVLEPVILDIVQCEHNCAMCNNYFEVYKHIHPLFVIFHCNMSTQI